MKIYLSGKISDLPKEEATKLFKRAEDEIRRDFPQDEIVNPLKNGLQEDASWEEHMLRDLQLLAECGMVYFLSNWDESVGASIEHRWARRTKKIMIYQDDRIRGGYSNFTQIKREKI